MKKIVIAMLAFSAFIFSANAQERSGKMKHHRHHHGKSMMMKGISLSAAQKDQLKTNWTSTRQQLAELNKNEDITVREYKTRKAAIMKAQKQQMDNVFTPEQKTQLEKNKADFKAKREVAAAKRMDKMKARLNLSEEQLTKMKASREASMAKAKTIRENSQLSLSEKKEQLMAIRKEQKDSFKQLLTQEQISKIEQMKKSRMDKDGSK